MPGTSWTGQHETTKGGTDTREAERRARERNIDRIGIVYRARHAGRQESRKTARCLSRYFYLGTVERTLASRRIPGCLRQDLVHLPLLLLSHRIPFGKPSTAKTSPCQSLPPSRGRRRRRRCFPVGSLPRGRGRFPLRASDRHFQILPEVLVVVISTPYH